MSEIGKKKVVILITGLLRGGAQRIVLDLVRGVDKNHYDPIVVYLKSHRDSESSLIEEFEKSDIRTISCIGGVRFSYSEAYLLYKILKIEQPDILHTFLPYAGILGRVVGYFAGVKKIISTQCNLPATYTFKTYFLDKVTLFFADAWVGATEGIERAYGTSCAYVSASSWHQGRRHFTIVAGVDLPSFDARVASTDSVALRHELGIPIDTTFILMTARFVAWKGHRDLIEAFALLQEPAHLGLIGWGDLQQELESVTKDLSIETRVHFLGARTDVPELLSISDVYVQSHCKINNLDVWIGVNTSQMEACAAMVPSVSTRVPDVEFLIEDTVTGLLVEQNNPRKIADAILYLIKNKREALRMAYAARERVEARYSVVAMVGSYELLWELLVKP